MLEAGPLGLPKKNFCLPDPVGTTGVGRREFDPVGLKGRLANRSCLQNGRGFFVDAPRILPIRRMEKKRREIFNIFH